MELFVIGLVFGAATAQGKAVTKAVAKGYMAVSEKTREVVSTLREDMRGAIEEAKEERDQAEPTDEAPGHEAEALALREESAPAEIIKKDTTVSAAPTASAAAVSAVSTSNGSAKQTPSVLKSIAKRYMAMTEKTRDAVSGIRENVRDAIEEARYEREQAAQRSAQAEADASTAAEIAVVTPNPAAVIEVAPVKKKTSPAAKSTRTKASDLKVSVAASKPARSTRTKTAGTTVEVVTPAPVPAKRGRPKKSSGAQSVNASEALLEVAEIAADAL